MAGIFNLWTERQVVILIAAGSPPQQMTIHPMAEAPGKVIIHVCILGV